MKKQPTLSILLLIAGIYAGFSQKVSNGSVTIDYPAPYTVFDMLGHVMKQGYGTIVSFCTHPNGVYITEIDHNTVVVMVQNGQVIGTRTETVLAALPGPDTNQVCISGMEPRPFHDTASLAAYIRSRIDTCTTDSAMMCELTRFATEWYPQALHGTSVQQAYLSTIHDVFEHFLQIQTWGNCGDQAIFLSNLLFYFRGLHSCGLAMGHINIDSARNSNATHAQLIVKLPVGTDTIWAIFDSQNGIVYRDSIGNLIDFRDIFKKAKKPIADEMKPIGRFFNISECERKESATMFPFHTLKMYRSDRSPIDTVLATGERSLSFAFNDSSSWTASWRKVGESHGYDMDSVSAKQLADMMPLFANIIWETTNHTEHGIPENIVFANEVREFTKLYGFKRE